MARPQKPAIGPAGGSPQDLLPPAFSPVSRRTAQRRGKNGESDFAEGLRDERRADRLGGDARAEMKRVLAQSARYQVKGQQVSGQVEKIAPVVGVPDSRDDAVQDDLQIVRT